MDVVEEDTATGTVSSLSSTIICHDCMNYPCKCTKMCNECDSFPCVCNEIDWGTFADAQKGTYSVWEAKKDSWSHFINGKPVSHEEYKRHQLSSKSKHTDTEEEWKEGKRMRDMINVREGKLL